MKADDLMSRLDKLKRVGRDRWQACCPAHDDRSPSLSIKLAQDGKVLVHCFAGCTAREVVESVGLRLSDLFPRGDLDRFAYARQMRIAAAVERAEMDTLIVKIAKNDISRGKVLTTPQQEEVRAALVRLQGGGI